MTDEFAAVAQLPPPSAVGAAPELVSTLQQRVSEFVRHPENHKQALRFLCVGGSGYVVNNVAFWLMLHFLGVQHTAAFWLAALAGTANNFWWNRNWTFDAAHHHIAKQGVRFLVVAAMVAGLAYAIYLGIVASTGLEKTLANAIAYIIATPFSFVAQKLWSFKA